jgi:branched-chain amino acid aminotransferase
MSVHICLNGKLVPADQPVLMADNRSYRYGDGLFETIKVWKRNIQLEKFHFERLFAGLEQLKFRLPALLTIENLKQQIFSLCEKNNCTALARVRLSVFRGNGGIYDEPGDLQYLVECWPVNESVNQLNDNGLVVDIYPEARKSCDKFSHLKSANYLPYVMAAIYAKENKLDDCLVLNAYDRIADSTIANVFLIKDKEIFTPPLSEGCVNGVMRRYLTEQYEIRETMLTIDDMLSADELFLTNAMYGIRWIKQFRNKTYKNVRVLELHQALRTTLWT